MSHVSFVRVFGSSWSQPLLANRPSKIVGSGRNTTSRPEGDATAAAAAGVDGGASGGIGPAAGGGDFAGEAVFGMTPS